MWHRILTVLLVLSNFLVLKPGYAHHGYFAFFDADKTIELVGVIKKVTWRNPHIHFTLTVEQDGKSEDWEVESQSIGMLRRMGGIEKSMFNVGDTIKVSGNPSRKNDRLMHVFNILLNDGREIVTEPTGSPIYTKKAASSPGTWLAGLDQTEPNEDGLFRTWSQPVEGALTLTLPEIPMTEAARAKKAQFDPLEDEITANCAPKGMPTIMDAPTPTSFEENEEGNIIMRMEEYDTKRVIYMDKNRPSTNVKSILGLSTGHWEGDTLVVSTEQADWKFHDEFGVPQSENAKMVERFTLTNDNRKLEYSLTVTDPENFTGPVTYTKYYLALPGAEVLPFGCVVEEPN